MAIRQADLNGEHFFFVFRINQLTLVDALFGVPDQVFKHQTAIPRWITQFVKYLATVLISAYFLQIDLFLRMGGILPFAHNPAWLLGRCRPGNEGKQE